MSQDFFRFRQFIVRQESTAMKVGEDSVLLGAWVCVDGAVRILDVGAGTGLLALMMAQRYPDALIDAVEIDCEAHQQAIENVEESKWSDRIRVICDDFILFAEQCPSRYNLIISNPPYFTASLKPVDTKRKVARHNDSLPHAGLLSGSAKLLAPEGILAVVLPTTEALMFIEQAAKYDMLVKRTLHLQSFPSKPVHRIFVELIKPLHLNKDFCKNNQSPLGTVERLCVEKADRSDKTFRYKQLTKDFYV